MRGVPKFVESIGGAGLILARAVGYFPSVVWRRDARRDLFRQLYATGIRTLPVVTIADARQTMSTVSNAMASATRAFDGVAEVADGVRDEQTMADLKGGLAAFRTAAESLNAKDLMERVGTLVDNLNVVAERVKAGEGTLGRLTTDAKLYDELNALLRDMRQVLDNYRDTTPISTFSSLATGAL